MDGWIKLHRKILEWEWYTDNPTKILFIHLLLTCSNQSRVWKGIELKAGEIITSISKLKNETCLTTKQLRRSLKKLEKTLEMGKQTTNKYTKITLLNYADYNSLGEPKGQAEGQTKGKQRANKKVHNNVLIELEKKKELLIYKEKEYKEKEKELFPDKNTFEIFWHVYDKKVGKAKSERLWNNLKKDEQAKAIDHAKYYIKSQPDKQYRKNPETYIRGKAFNDEIINQADTDGFVSCPEY